MMKLREIKQAVRTLSPEELAKLNAWLHRLIDTRESKQREHSLKEPEVSAQRQRPHKTYRLEKVSCGKENCKCGEGKLHGPYWYAYWTEKGKTKSQYIGKKLPKKKQGARRSTVRGVR
jgi:hypothetical protein